MDAGSQGAREGGRDGGLRPGGWRSDGDDAAGRRGARSVCTRPHPDLSVRTGQVMSERCQGVSAADIVALAEAHGRQDPAGTLGRQRSPPSPTPGLAWPGDVPSLASSLSTAWRGISAPGSSTSQRATFTVFDFRCPVGASGPSAHLAATLQPEDCQLPSHQGQPMPRSGLSFESNAPPSFLVCLFPSTVAAVLAALWTGCPMDI